MKSSIEIINELNSEGISIIENFYSKEFCNASINEINDAIKTRQESVVSKLDEGTAGDERLFKIEKVSSSALKFKNNDVLNNIFKVLTNNNIKSCFILGGKVEFRKNQINNSGGGWHRDSDSEQYKSIVYLNDVDENNGPFLFIRESNKFDLKRRIIKNKKSILENLYYFIRKANKYPPRYSDEIVNEFLIKNKLKPIEVKAKAGTVILFNSTFLHRGKNLAKGGRFTFTNYMFKNRITTQYLMNKQFKHFFIK